MRKVKYNFSSIQMLSSGVCTFSSYSEELVHLVSSCESLPKYSLVVIILGSSSKVHSLMQAVSSRNKWNVHTITTTNNIETCQSQELRDILQDSTKELRILLLHENDMSQLSGICPPIQLLVSFDMDERFYLSFLDLPHHVHHIYSVPNEWLSEERVIHYEYPRNRNYRLLQILEDGVTKDYLSMLQKEKSLPRILVIFRTISEVIEFIGTSSDPNIVIFENVLSIDVSSFLIDHIRIQPRILVVTTLSRVCDIESVEFDAVMIPDVMNDEEILNSCLRCSINTDLHILTLPSQTEYISERIVALKDVEDSYFGDPQEWWRMYDQLYDMVTVKGYYPNRFISKEENLAIWMYKIRKCSISSNQRVALEKLPYWEDEDVVNDTIWNRNYANVYTSSICGRRIANEYVGWCSRQRARFHNTPLENIPPEIQRHKRTPGTVVGPLMLWQIRRLLEIPGWLWGCGMRISTNRRK